MSTKSGKTTESKSHGSFPWGYSQETTVEADLHMTFIIKDQMSKKEAEEMIHDILDGCYDHLQIKDLKVFQREV